MDDMFRFLLCFIFLLWFFTAELSVTTNSPFPQMVLLLKFCYHTYSFFSCFYFRIMQERSNYLSLVKQLLVAADILMELLSFFYLLTLSFSINSFSFLFFKQFYQLIEVCLISKISPSTDAHDQLLYRFRFLLKPCPFYFQAQLSFFSEWLILFFDLTSISFSFKTVLQIIILLFILSENMSRNSFELILSNTASEVVITPLQLFGVLLTISQKPQSSPLVRIINGKYLPAFYLFFLKSVSSPSTTINTASGCSPYLKSTVFFEYLQGFESSNILSISLRLISLKSQILLRNYTFSFSYWYLKWPEKVLQKVYKSSQSTQVFETDLAECSFKFALYIIFSPKCSLAPIFRYRIGAEIGSSAF